MSARETWKPRAHGWPSGAQNQAKAAAPSNDLKPHQADVSPSTSSPSAGARAFVGRPTSSSEPRPLTPRQPTTESIADQIDELESRARRLQIELYQKGIEILEARDQKLAAQQQLAEWKNLWEAERQEFAERLSTLEAETRDAAVDAGRYKAELDVKSGLLAQRDRDISALQDRTTSLEAEISDQQATAEKLRQRYSAEFEQLKQAEATASELRRELSKSSDQTAHWQQIAADVKAKQRQEFEVGERMRAHVAEVEQKMAETSKRFNDAGELLSRRDDQISELRSQMAVLNEAFIAERDRSRLLHDERRAWQARDVSKSGRLQNRRVRVVQALKIQRDQVGNLQQAEQLLEIRQREITELRNEVQRVRESNEKLKQEVASTEDLRRSHDQMAVDLRAAECESKSKSKAIAKQEEKMDDVRAALESARIEVDGLTKDRNEALSHVEQLEQAHTKYQERQQTRLQSLSSDLSDALEERQMLANESERQSRSVATLRMEVNGLMEQRRDALAQVEQLEQDRVRREQAHVESQRQLEARVEALSAELSEVLEARRALADESESQCKTVAALRMEVNGLGEQRLDALAQIEQLEHERTKREHAHAESQRQLETRVEALSAELTEALEARQALADESESQSKSLAALRMQVNGLDEQRSNALAQVEQLERERTKREHAHAESHRQLETRVEALSSELSEALEARQALADESESQNKALAALRMQVNGLDEQRRDALAQVEQLEQDRAKRERAHAESHRQLETRVDALSAELSEALEARQALADESESQSKSLAALQMEVNGVEEQRRDALAQVEQLEQDRAKRERAHAESHRQLEARIEALSAELSEALEARQALTDESESQRRALETLGMDFNGLEEQRRDALAQVEQLEQDRTKRERAHVESQRQLETRVDALSCELSEALEGLQASTDESERRSKALAALRMEVNGLTEQRRDALAQVEQLEQDRTKREQAHAGSKRQLETRVQAAQAETDRQRAFVTELEATKSALEAKVLEAEASAAQSKQAYEEALQTKESSVVELHEALNEVRRDKQAAAKDLAERAEAISVLNQQRGELKSQIAELEDTKLAQSKQVAELEQAVATAASNLAAVEEAHAEALTESTEELQRLQEALSAARDEGETLSKQVPKLEAALADSKEAARQEANAHQERVEQLQSAQEAALFKQNELSEALQSSQQRESALQNQLTAAGQDRISLERTLQQQLADLQESKAVSQQDLVAAQSALEDRSSQLETLQHEMAGFSSLVEERDQKVADLTESLRSAREGNESLRLELESARSTLGELVTQSEAREAVSAKTDEKLHGALTEISELRTEIEDLSSQKVKLETECVDLKAAAESVPMIASEQSRLGAEKLRLSQALEGRNVDFKKLQEQFNRSKQDLRETQKKLEERGRNLAVLTDDIANAKSSETKLQRELGKLREQVSGVEQRLADKQRKVVDLENALATERDQKKRNGRETEVKAEQLQSALKEREQELKEREREVRQLKERLQEAQSEVRAKEAEADEQRHTLNRLKTKSPFEVKSEAWHKEKQSLEDRVKELEQLKEQRAAAEQDYDRRLSDYRLQLDEAAEAAEEHQKRIIWLEYEKRQLQNKVAEVRSQTGDRPVLVNDSARDAKLAKIREDLGRVQLIIRAKDQQIEGLNQKLAQAQEQLSNASSNPSPSQDNVMEELREWKKRLVDYKASIEKMVKMKNREIAQLREELQGARHGESSARAN